MGRGLNPDLTERSNLTKGQLAIWAGQQLHPDAPLYNMAFCFAIDGPVDRELFERSFAWLLERHEALRTVVAMDGEVPVQRLLPRFQHPLDYQDLSAEADPAETVERLVQARCERAFALDRRLFDTALYKLSDRHYVWYFAQHHLLSDAWSVAVLFRDLAQEYGRLAKDEGGTEGAAPAFASFVAIEREQRSDPEAAEYWRRYATPELAPPRLYGRRPSAVSTGSARLSYDLGPGRTQALRALAQRPEGRALTAELGVFNLMAALLVAFQHRVSGERRVALGALSHNRATAHLRETVGLFTEVFPLAVEVGPRDTFLDVLAKARAETQGFFKFAAAGAGDARQNRGFNTVLNFIRGSFGEFAGIPVRATWLHPGHHDREHHLRLHVHDFDASGRLQLLFDFNRDVFDEGGRAAAVGHFVRLVDALIDDWTLQISDVELLSPEERARQWSQFDETAAAAAPGATVVESFEEQAVLAPEAVAVMIGGRTLSYGELDRQADRLAATLRARGLGVGARIGLCMSRSSEAVIAILAVLKAGAAYVPVDPSWPEGRMSSVLEEAGVSAVLTRPGTPVTLAERWRERELVVDRDALRGVPWPKAEPSAAREPQAPAYVMFTSGSTGRPKGVVVGHRALANYVAWARAKYVGARRLAFPLFSPLTFDLTVTSIFVPLTSGGRVVVYPETSRGADLALLDVLADGAVDVIKLTPSHMSLLGEGKGVSSRVGPSAAGRAKERPSRVRQLIFGGEALPRSLALRALELFGDGVEIHNEYGPTEATVGCVVHTFDPHADRADAVPIGSPITGSRAYVLDDRLRPVPEGVVGTLFVAGVGLADGYLDRPGLTAQRFVTSPVGAGERIYDTGDLARFCAPGVLEYVGRGDDQLKIRGARVEPGEVEAALVGHPEIEACVVTVETRHEATSTVERVFCRRCALSSEYPGVEFDSEGVCSHCRAFERYGHRVDTYFGSPDELRAILHTAAAERPGAEYDCLALLSGGKDSTYVLCRLVDMGFRVLAFTLDNGFISDQAKANIGRVVEALGVDHVWGSTPAMNEIFVDSLERHANVCHGCFKTIYTLSMAEALKRDIPFIVTGLSRGQFFETRLTEELFTDPELEVENVDDIVLDARKAYHRVDDAVRRLLDVSMFQDDRVFERVRFVDFYRYVPVDLDELMRYLDARVPWVRPADTGRSTNCLINDVGIWFHQRERGFHNYALPYSWDVRMGHKTRDAALAELDDEIDETQVLNILDEVGYRGDLTTRQGEARLVACYTARRELPPAALRGHLARILPDFMMPSRFVRLEALPTTAHGKVDRAALSIPAAARLPERGVGGASFVAPRTGLERAIARVWCEVLGVERVGIRDNFFDLGGDSIRAIQIVARCRRVGLTLSPAQLFESLTVEALARVCGAAAEAPEVDEAVGPAMLTPAQHWFFEVAEPELAHWNHVLWVSAPGQLAPRRLEKALAEVAHRHEALRVGFTRSEGRWSAAIAPEAASPPLTVVDLADLDEDGRGARLARLEEQLDRGFPLDGAPLLRVGLARGGGERERLLFVAHHLIVDAVSWSVLLADLETAYDTSTGDGRRSLPPAVGIGRWTRALAEEARSRERSGEADYWRDVLAANVAQIPLDLGEPSPDTVASAQLVEGGLDARQSAALLEEVPAKGRFRVEELLVAALAETLADWTGAGEVGVFLEGHGREDLAGRHAAMDTVGWLSTLYPVRLEAPAGADPGASLRAARERLRALPGRGLGYGLLRHVVGRPSEPLEPWAPDEGGFPTAARRRFGVLFNYLGRADRLTPVGSFFRVERPLELSRSPEARRPFLVEVDAMVVDGRLRVRWGFSTRRHHRATVEARSATFCDRLGRLIEYCIGDRSEEVAASDFPLANLDAAKLGKLAAVLGRGDPRRGNE